MTQAPAQIILLNGPPRAGKSSIAHAIQALFPGVWVNVGVDQSMALLPSQHQPGPGLRPGGERPDLEPLAVQMYLALYGSIAVYSRLGLAVVADVGHHDAYSVPRHILPQCARLLAGLPALLVGVHCALEVIAQRRAATGMLATLTPGGPLERWQTAVHQPGIYDLSVDTTATSPAACAVAIQQHLLGGPPPTALARLAAG